MRKLVVIPTLLGLSIALAACSSQPNANLEEARSAYDALQSNPQSIKLAALETEDAGQRLEAANQAYQADADEEKVDQLAYLASQSIELAEQTIALRSAERELAQVDNQRTQARLESREAQLKRQQEEIRSLQENLNARQTDRGTLVTFGDVLFDLDSTQIKPGGLRDIQKLADFLNEREERQVIIEGYTDSTGSESYNQQLSERRAQAVERALIRMGVDPSRLVTRGYGEQFPVASNDNPSGRAMNRRVEVTISRNDQPVKPRGAMQGGQQGGNMGGSQRQGGMQESGGMPQEQSGSGMPSR